MTMTTILPLTSSSPHPLLHFIIQDDCYKHLYRRSKDTSFIFERPERLRFVSLGLAAALAWDILHQTVPPDPIPYQLFNPQPSHSLSLLIESPRLVVSRSRRRISTRDPAVLRVHPSGHHFVSPDSPFSSTHASTCATERDNYLDHIIQLCRQAANKHQIGLSEVPEHLPQGDLWEGFSCQGFHKEIGD